MSRHWEALAPGQSAPSDPSKKFTLSAPAGCDIWRSKPEHNAFDAPAVVTRIKASEFKSVAVTVTADWKTLYDQAGLLLVFPGQPGVQPKDSKSWIKAGVEVFKDGQPKFGVVGVYAYSDWSLSPRISQSKTATFRFVRDGTALWVYASQDGQEEALREICWAFLEDRGGDAEIWVGTYVAKPKPHNDDAKAKLEATFEDFKLETA